MGQSPSPTAEHLQPSLLKSAITTKCRNGHNSFAITATINESGKPRSQAFMAGGCLHDEVAEHFPELAPCIKWHHCSSDWPMH